ncbi:barstar family protein [Gordonia neofelifaecis]|uniref:Barstar (barnase inhibitor) domain-containing protein n=1 Tax=Gordonia neofelifaecis NRRL B-59395 TaxID=644548 RepID=F1YJT5_9ACTN|nr:barstar family protein [Gordonia neofelifaecis]EGD55017.1 hypothetical protein SCNU_10826 [Gordonia neofelifaecis NRRL B-59395]
MTAIVPAELLSGPGPAAALAVGDVSAARTGAVVRRLSGARMRTLDGLYDAFARAWSFPDHFGRNKDAFDDCLGDLPLGLRTAIGAPATGYLTVITDAEQLLSDASDDDFEWFATSPEHWRERSLRSGRGFGLVLSADDDTAPSVAARWEAAGDPLIRLRQD